MSTLDAPALIAVTGTAVAASAAAVVWVRHELRCPRRIENLPPEVVSALQLHPPTWQQVRARETISVAETSALIDDITRKMRAQAELTRGKVRL